MENEFIPYEEALALKELGFDGTCYGAYNSKKQWERATSDYWDNGSLFRINQATTSELEVLAPLYQQAFRWFREKHKLPSYIGHYGINGYSFVIDFTDNRNLQFRAEYKYYTYEEAELSCLKKLIELVKEKE